MSREIRPELLSRRGEIMAWLAAIGLFVGLFLATDRWGSQPFVYWLFAGLIAFFCAEHLPRQLDGSPLRHPHGGGRDRLREWSPLGAVDLARGPECGGDSNVVWETGAGARRDSRISHSRL